MIARLPASNQDKFQSWTQKEKRPRKETLPEGRPKSSPPPEGLPKRRRSLSLRKTKNRPSLCRCRADMFHHRRLPHHSTPRAPKQSSKKLTKSPEITDKVRETSDNKDRVDVKKPVNLAGKNRVLKRRHSFYVARSSATSRLSTPPRKKSREESKLCTSRKSPRVNWTRIVKENSAVVLAKRRKAKRTLREMKNQLNRRDIPLKKTRETEVGGLLTPPRRTYFSYDVAEESEDGSSTDEC